VELDEGFRPTIRAIGSALVLAAEQDSDAQLFGLAWVNNQALSRLIRQERDKVKR
jgi:hypothetical protein